jgi:hypothetical protein
MGIQEQFISLDKEADLYAPCGKTQAHTTYNPAKTHALCRGYHGCSPSWLVNEA